MRDNYLTIREDLVRRAAKKMGLNPAFFQIVQKEDEEHLTYCSENCVGFVPSVRVDILVRLIQDGTIDIDKASDSVVFAICSDKEEIREKILENCCIRMMNGKEEILKAVPHVKLLDLAAVPYIMLSEKDEVTEQITGRQYLSCFEIGDQEILDAAFANTKKAGFQMFSMRDVMKSVGGPVPREESTMHIVTNAMMINGAAVIMYPDLMAGFVRQLGDEAIVLPSSVNEIILVNALEANTETLKDMHEDAMLTEENFLSNSVYAFNALTHRWRFV